MADEKKLTKDKIVKSQANYKGNTHFDLVKVTIVEDGSFYKKGDTDVVHPTVAEILKTKGLVTTWEKYTPEVKKAED